MTERLTVKTSLARAGYDRIYLRDYELTTDLIDDSVWSVLSVALGNRRLSNDESAVINALAVVTSVGDPRVWPLKVTRLIGSYGHPFAATAAGGSFLDEIPLGPWPTKVAAEFLEEIAGASDEQDWVRLGEERVRAFVANDRPVPGFGVAGRERDERFVDFKRWYEARPATHGPHWRLLEGLRIECAALELLPNIGGAIAAVALDFGLRPIDVALVTGASIHWATLANAREALRESPEVLRRIPSEFVEYVGPAARVSPRARAAREPEGET